MKSTHVPEIKSSFSKQAKVQNQSSIFECTIGRNVLKKNFKAQLFNILKKKSGLILRHGQLVKDHNKRIIFIKNIQTMHSRN